MKEATGRGIPRQPQTSAQGTGNRPGMRRRIAWHSNPTPLWIRPSSALAARCRGRRRGEWRLLSSLLGYAVAVALTFLGLLAITFFIGRVVPIDPVLAAVGDRAPPAVYEAARLEMGLDRPLPVQFVALYRGGPDRRSRHIGLDRQAGRRRPRPGLSGNAGNGDARHHHRRAVRRADGRVRGEPPGQPLRPGRSASSACSAIPFRPSGWGWSGCCCSTPG